VTAAVVTIAITLIAGFALWGYVNGQAAASENGIGVANAANVNYLNERFVISDMGFGPNNHTLGFFLYNNGEVGLRITQVLLYDRAVPHTVYYNFTGGSGTCEKNLGLCACLSPASISPAIGSGMTPLPSQGDPSLYTINLEGSGLKCQFTPGTTYYLVVTGLYGNVVVSYACYSTPKVAGCDS
jgi:hypothetical protein